MEAIRHGRHVPEQRIAAGHPEDRTIEQLQEPAQRICKKIEERINPLHPHFSVQSPPDSAPPLYAFPETALIWMLRGREAQRAVVSGTKRSAGAARADRGNTGWRNEKPPKRHVWWRQEC